MAVMTIDNTDKDRELLQEANQGRWEAFEQLMTRFEPRVLAIAKRILQQQQDAEDVTQKTFIKVMQNLKQFRGDASVATWIQRIATNEAISALRQRRRARAVLVPGVGDDDDDPRRPEFIAPWTDDPVHMAQREEVRRLLDEALSELDEKYRLVFILRDIEQLSTREAAETLGISESNVKVRLLRARLQLRERLTRSLGDQARQLIRKPHNH